jgi:hypothetical protein
MVWMACAAISNWVYPKMIYKVMVFDKIFYGRL